MPYFISFFSNFIHDNPITIDEIGQENNTKDSLPGKKFLKICLLGDSISLHYGIFLQEYLNSFVEYAQKEDKEGTIQNLNNEKGVNSGDSSKVLSFLKSKIHRSGIDSDILLFNCGLHDIKTDPLSCSKQVPLHQYEKNLKEILKTIECFRTKPIWIRTTPFDENRHNRFNLNFSRYSRDCIEYNLVADRIMKTNNVPIIDLFNFTLNLGDKIYCDHVHFTEAVREKQAAYIAGWLGGWLTSKLRAY